MVISDFYEMIKQTPKHLLNKKIITLILEDRDRQTSDEIRSEISLNYLVDHFPDHCIVDVTVHYDGFIITIVAPADATFMDVEKVRTLADLIDTFHYKFDTGINAEVLVDDRVLFRGNLTDFPSYLNNYYDRDNNSLLTNYQNRSIEKIVLCSIYDNLSTRNTPAEICDDDISDESYFIKVYIV